MEKKKGIIIAMTCLILVTLTLLGLTYAYFRTKIIGNESTKPSISASTATLKLIYNDGSDGVIGADNMIPSDTVYSKTFTVESKTNQNVKYGVYLIDIINTFELNDDVKYTLKCATNGTLECKGVNDETFPKYSRVLISNEIEPGKTHTYTLSFTYKDSGTDQSVDMGKKISAKIQIYGEDLNGVIPVYEQNTLAYNVLNNAVSNNVDGTVLDATALDESFSIENKVAKEVTEIDEKLLSITADDYGNSLYFRGNVTDNYVNFADMCWRIVRIQGDGSVKLILEDRNSLCNDTDNFKGDWAIGIGNYGYSRDYITNTNGETSSQQFSLLNYLQPTTSANKSMAKAFYDFQETLTEEEKTKLKTGDWCLGNTPYANILNQNNKKWEYTSLLSQNLNINDYRFDKNDIYYNAFMKLNFRGEYLPTLKCSGETLDNFESVTFDSNEIIKSSPMYVATITAEEVAYAGGVVEKPNANYYLKNSNFNVDSIYDNRWRYSGFWTLSPEAFHYPNDAAYRVRYDGTLITSAVHNDGATSFRPSIILKSNVTISGGNGTNSDPYVIG